MSIIHLLSFVLIQFVSAQSSSEAQNATAFALMYGYPLLAFEKLAPSLLHSIGPNQLLHNRELQNANFRGVVSPNVDTLYSTAIFDLSHSDLVISVPEVPSSQFALFSYYDPYGDNFANTGTGSFDKAGDYKLTLRANGTSAYGVKPENASSDYKATIYSPSAYGIFLIRWLLTPTNLDAVHSYQNNTSLKNLSRPFTIGPYVTELAGANRSKSPAENALNLLAEFAKYDGPEIVSDEEKVTTALMEAGISDGKYNTPANVNITKANETAIIEAVTSWNSAQESLNNGWTNLEPNKTGDFGVNYGIRTAAAASGYLMLKAPIAVYPIWSNTSSTASSLFEGASLDIPVGESLIYTFSRKPPLQEAGFWSLTAYQDNYLIPNSRNVYALGDRSNLTYPDGSPVYGNNTSAESGEFQILIQAADVSPPANWTSNWLPAPSGGGSITAILRLFAAEEALINGDYDYPMVTRQGAIVASLNTTNSSSPTPSTTPTPYTGGSEARRALPSSVKFAMLMLFGTALYL